MISDQNSDESGTSKSIENQEEAPNSELIAEEKDIKSIDATHWLTKMMHQASICELEKVPAGVWSSSTANQPELLRRFTIMLSSHENTPPHVLSWLSKFDDKNLLERIAEHPNTPEEILAKLADSDHHEVRAAIADNQNASFEVLFSLSLDPHPDVKYRLAENPALPDQIIQILCQDENPYISHRANQSARKQRVQTQETSEAHNDRLTVLIVDDDDVTRLILSLALKNDQKVKIVGQAASGKEGLALALEHQPDIVLMDIGMPGMDGIDATAKIKSFCPETKVIMVTSHDTLEEIISAFGHGAEGYHLKSTPNHDLSKAIRIVASGAYWLDPGITSMVLRELANKSLLLLKKMSDSVEQVENAMSDSEESVLRIADDYLRNGMIEEAKHLYESALFIAKKQHGEDSDCARKALSRLADLQFREEEYGSCELSYLNLIAMQSKLLELDDLQLEKYLALLAELYEFRCNFEQAELFYSWLLRVREKSGKQEKAEETRNRLLQITSKAGKSRKSEQQ